jgi:hypothetical protein
LGKNKNKELPDIYTKFGSELLCVSGHFLMPAQMF